MSPHQVNTWAAASPQGRLDRLSYLSPALPDTHVQIQISHCGLCASDVHLIDGDWGDASVFPQVCGHEVVGFISQLGAEVQGLQLGQRVGVGWYKSACLECEFCRMGDEQHCSALIATCAHGERGGLADYLTCDGRFVFPIPERLTSEHAAPLLCAGVTVYTALKRATRPGMAVGIVGVGGLGHLALQFAAKIGCRVTAFSSTAGKRDEALLLGASHFVEMTGLVDRQGESEDLDFILITSAAACNWPSIIARLRPRGTLCFAGMPPPVTLDISAMMYKTLSVTTANVGGRQDIRDTLAFAAEQQIQPWVQQWPMEQVNAAIDQLRLGHVRYRAVLHNPVAIAPGVFAPAPPVC